MEITISGNTVFILKQGPSFLSVVIFKNILDVHIYMITYYIMTPISLEN